MSEQFLNLDEKIFVCTSNTHKFGTDAFLLADFTKCKQDDVVFDIGTGCGIIPFIIEKKFSPKKIVGLDIQQNAIDLFNKGIEKSKLNEKIFAFLGDVKNIDKDFKKNSFSVVVSNPPYKKLGKGIKNPDKENLIARHEYLCDINDICRSSSFLLCNKGKLFICQRPERLCDVLLAMRNNNIEPKLIRFVKTTVNDVPWLFLVYGVKNGGEFLKIGQDIIVYNDNNEYTDQIKEIYNGEKNGK